jgi:hypothetical protein
MARIINGQVITDKQRKFEKMVLVGTSILSALVTYYVAKKQYEEMLEEDEDE